MREILAFIVLLIIIHVISNGLSFTLNVNGKPTAIEILLIERDNSQDDSHTRKETK